mmetsp:Transcript_108138/g.186671  ORF Transcript_108138/g.186671 Transcript_108138/m.186671 type:complete len:238 (+) Transcript_108138:104-817(+)
MRIAPRSVQTEILLTPQAALGHGSERRNYLTMIFGLGFGFAAVGPCGVVVSNKTPTLASPCVWALRQVLRSALGMPHAKASDSIPWVASAWCRMAAANHVLSPPLPASTLTLHIPWAPASRLAEQRGIHGGRRCSSLPRPPRRLHPRQGSHAALRGSPCRSLAPPHRHHRSRPHFVGQQRAKAGDDSGSHLQSRNMRSGGRWQACVSAPSPVRAPSFVCYRGFSSSARGLAGPLGNS